jgi:hypothetical protein
MQRQTARHDPKSFFCWFFSMIAADEIFILNTLKATYGKPVASLTQ